MSKIVVEDCLKISVSQVNEDTGAQTKQLIEYDPGLFNLPDDYVKSQEDRVGMPRQWGLADFFSLEKPEWIDTDEWLEETLLANSYCLHLAGGLYGGRYTERVLDITASPPKKNQLIFTHGSRKIVRLPDDRIAYEEGKKSYVVNLTKAPRKYGGFAFYFQCPLGHDGIPCRRDASMLYLPPGATYFGCRRCYNLSYACRNASRPGRTDRSDNRIWDRLLQLYQEHTSAEKKEDGLQ